MSEAAREQPDDVVIVGAGAAGLSAAITLGRAKRSVVVVDSGEPRNAPADGVHGFVTRDGMAPRELVLAGRAEAEGYGVRFVDDRATTAAGDLSRGFTVTTEAGAVLSGRRLLATTGLTDVLPDIPGLREQWGRGVVHCPYCHGWEIREKSVGVVASGPFAVHQALLFRQWTDDVTLLLHDGQTVSDDDLEKLDARGIPQITGRIERVVSTPGGIEGVVVAGVQVPFGALAVTTGVRARAGFLADLGLDATPHPSGAGSRVEVDPTGRTSVPGVWAAGNVADPMVQVVMAAAAGVAAAASINMDLIDEEITSAVAARRASASA